MEYEEKLRRAREEAETVSSEINKMEMLEFSFKNK